MALTINDILKQRLAHGFPSMVSHPSGWNDILQRLHDELMTIESNYTVVQTKEKFGSLRFYAKLPDDVSQQTWDAAYAAIHRAEEESARTCETCGKPGVQREGGWIRTLCDTCEAERVRN